MSLLRHHQLLMSRSIGPVPPIMPDLWLDGADQDSIVITGGKVSDWLDKSGNDFHVSQSSSGNRPSLGADGGVVFYNGNGGANTDGSTLQFLHRELNGWSFNIYVVVSDVVQKSTGASSVISRTTGFIASSSHYQYIDTVYTASTSQVRALARRNGPYGIATTGAIFTLGKTNLLKGRFLSATNRSIRVNSGAEATNTTVITDLGAGNVLFLGTERICNTSFPANGASLTILEVLIYETDLNSTDDTLVTDYITSKWSI